MPKQHVWTISSLISVASLPTSGVENNPTGYDLFAFANALPSQSGHGAYLQHGQYFYELVLYYFVGSNSIK